MTCAFQRHRDTADSFQATTVTRSDYKTQDNNNMSLTEVSWTFPDSSNNSSDQEQHSREAVLALQSAQTAARNFEKVYAVCHAQREQSVPSFDGDEVLISPQPLSYSHYTAQHELRTVRIIVDLHQGSFGDGSEKRRSRFADRSMNGHYAVKYLQTGLIHTEHASSAATEMVLEARILMNLVPHPNICQCYGINGNGIDSLLTAGRKGFFIITDRISESLADRIQRWKREDDESSSSSKKRQERLGERLEMATDIASALVYLHNRCELVYYLRPDKVGFDTRYDRIKLCDFGQSRQKGMAAGAPHSVTMSDNMQTVAYTAPEVFCNAAATTASDVYAFGMMVWELLSLEQPYLGWDRARHFQQAVRRNERPHIPQKNNERWPKPVSEVVENCWDPHLRPNMQIVHESLEMALLFEENEEEEEKADFLKKRRSSSSCERFEMEARRLPQRRSTSTAETASPTSSSGDRTPRKPRRILESRHSSVGDSMPMVKTPDSGMRRRKSVDPQLSTQSTPGGAPTSRRGRRSSAHGPTPDSRRPSSRSTSLRVASSKLAMLEALVADRTEEGEHTQQKPAQSGSDDTSKEVTTEILAKLGMHLDDEEKTVSTNQSEEKSVGPESVSNDFAPKTPRQRRRGRDSARAPRTPMTPRTPASRRRFRRSESNSSADGSVASSASSNPQRRSARRKKKSSPKRFGGIQRATSFDSSICTKALENPLEAQDGTAATRLAARPVLKKYASERGFGLAPAAGMLAGIVGNICVQQNGKAAPVVSQQEAASRRGSL